MATSPVLTMAPKFFNTYEPKIVGPWMKWSTVLWLMVVLFAELSSADEDTQSWTWLTLNLKTYEKIRYSLYLDYRRANEVSESLLYLISPRVSYTPFNNFSTGMNYTYINFKSQGEFKYQHRVELEFNPQVKIADRIMVKNRNRLEYRWIENKGDDNTRSRHRLEFNFPLNLSIAKSFYASNEFFYDFRNDKYNENRGIPCGLKFKIHDRASMKLFYMVQSKRSADKWSTNHVIGSHIVMSL